MVKPAIDLVDKNAQFAGFVYQIAVKVVLDYWGNERLTIFGAPNEMVVESPEGHVLLLVWCHQLETDSWNIKKPSVETDG